MPVIVVESLDQARALADHVLDADRRDPVVCVSTRHGEVTPLLDVETLAAAIGELPVYVLPTGECSWELTAVLPERFEVFGGASRIWWPGLRPTDDPRRHPLIFCWADYEAPESARRVVRELHRWGLDVHDEGLEPAVGTGVAPRGVRDPAGVEPGSLAGIAVDDILEVTVVDIQPGGTEVELPGGSRGLIINRRGKPAPVLVVGGTARVRVVNLNPAAHDIELGWHIEAVDTPDLASPPKLRVPTPAQVAALHRGIVGPAGPAAPRAVDEQVVEPPLEDTYTRLEALRGAAGQITRELDEEMAAARVRVADFVRDEFGDLTQSLESLEAALTEAGAEARSLRHQVEAAEREKRGAITELRKLRDRLNDTAKELRRERDRRVHAEDLLHGRQMYDDPEAQFRHEISVACDTLRAALNGQAGSPREFILGPDFLDSVAGLQGIDRAQIVEKTAAKLVGAPNVREHPFRTSDAGNAPQVIRADGAKAFRLYLQQGSSSARRLHYWLLADNRIELAKVGVHDDIVIR